MDQPYSLGTLSLERQLEALHSHIFTLENLVCSQGQRLDSVESRLTQTEQMAEREERRFIYWHKFLQWLWRLYECSPRFSDEDDHRRWYRNDGGMDD